MIRFVSSRPAPVALGIPSTKAESTPLDFDEVYAAHFHDVARWARAFGGLDADLDDLAQDVFLVVRRKLGTFSGPSLRAWLYGITRKTVSDYRRSAWLRRLRAGIFRDLDAPAARKELVSAGDLVERIEARRVLARVLARMSPVRRAAFVLFEIEGYSGAEIAELEGIPVATTYTRLHHARQDFLRFVAEITGVEPPEKVP